ncbi:MAG: kinesin motor protein cin8 [Chrysothrix sp. TS-e1954]|nr:MAG: kinesin motor protein cin8 [Chrysothrix sp. TS-e1954]
MTRDEIQEHARFRVFEAQVRSALYARKQKSVNNRLMPIPSEASDVHSPKVFLNRLVISFLLGSTRTVLASMAGPLLQASHAPKRSSMRPPPPPRPVSSRTHSALSGRASPADSTASNATISSRIRSPPTNGALKRKERDFEHDVGEETNINVVVRCRGRNDREVKENSGVVVQTDGVKGKTVELSMGVNAVSNKTYNFDRVFSPAADQGMVFDEVVAPILDQVLDGFNCTIFAYGQTGTGKTYTMSGDITDMLPLPDASGIIPRVLQSLFAKLENAECENAVKCSFIELYNEELRDLLAVDESVKLKIFEDASRKSHSATMVQGMEETHIRTASKGIDLLRIGSHKRQVAATKCNDLSSRSHTVFTITVYIKRVSESGEDFMISGKLNLVDLAGSENIQRSGAENKRATEAGLINKSLLTLGRVINALVDKGSHIPYRESKLTRLLQDSLGGRTKTCIIATLSPAKSNLEETISTLDYAFRAKNIRNKPQTNQLISKKTLIREWTVEVEKLKSELIATRQRNGVYLTSESYEEMTTESESRRILSEEQRDRIATMEGNLRNKAQELFSLTSSLTTMKKDNETTRQTLENTRGTLEETEVILEHTRRSLEEEEVLVEAHQQTEEKLVTAGKGLISTLGNTTSDIGGLNSKLRRRSDLQTLNRTNWTSSQSQVSTVTHSVEEKLSAFESHHQSLIAKLSHELQDFVQNETAKLQESRSFLAEKTNAFTKSEVEVNTQNAKARDDMNTVLEEIQVLREDVKQKVGEGLSGLSVAAQRISAGVINELEGFHTQLHASYNALGKDFKTTFDELVKHSQSQQDEADDLRRQLSEASRSLTKANESASERLESVVAEEKAHNAEERASLISQITSLVGHFGETQEKRLDSKVELLRNEIKESNIVFQKHQDSYNDSMDNWVGRGKGLHGKMVDSRERIKSKIKKDWSTANEQNHAIQSTAQSVHEETVGIVDAQMKHMDIQLQALDEIVLRIKTQNGHHHDSHVNSLQELGTTVKQSYLNIGEHFTESSTRTAEFSDELSDIVSSLSKDLDPLQQSVRDPLAHLREDVLASALTEYVPTGQTPQRVSYQYPRSLPRTEERDILIQRFRNPSSVSTGSTVTSSNDGDAGSEIVPDHLTQQSPSKAQIYTDVRSTTSSPTSHAPVSTTRSDSSSRPGISASGLRELDPNVSTDSANREPTNHTRVPPLKRQNTGGKVVDVLVGDQHLSVSLGPGAKPPRKAMAAIAEGRENVPPLSASVGPAVSGGRTLRRRGS